MKIVLDLETNGFLDKENLIIHCIVCKDIETHEVYRYNPNNLNDCLELLNKTEAIIGHNVLGFDIPVLKRCLNFTYKKQVFDTLLMSRLIWTNILDQDYKHKQLPAKLYGRHSLESWGYRLGLRKGDYQEHSDFTEYNHDMLEYCERDVEVTYLLYDKIVKENYSNKAIELEHKFASWIVKQEQHGVHFDETTAQSLHTILTKRKLELEDKLALAFPAWEKFCGNKVYKRDNRKKGIKAGVPVPIYKTEIFNPSSRQHIADRLITVLNWSPKSFTPTGQPEVNEKILNLLPYPEAKLISQYLMVQKRLGQLSDGDQAYLKLNKQGKIYGKVITNGAVTGRCTHHSPNLAQCVSSSSEYGAEFRSLFYSPSDMVMCGLDFSGLELRCLGSYLHNYDNGNFTKTLLEDDIHTANQKATGLSSRAKAKTFIYAYLYSCGDKKLSEILDVTHQEAKRVRDRFNKSIPAIPILNEAVKNKFRNVGYLNGIDGRRLIPRAEFSSLNTLLQSCGALLVKQGTIIINEELHKAGFKWGEDYAMVLHIHDEMQFIVKKEKLEEFKTIAKSIFKKTQDFFNFKTPLDGEIKVGDNWSLTH
jgi:DNA polymerase I